MIRLAPASERSSSPTPSTSSRLTQQWPESLVSIPESNAEMPQRLLDLATETRMPAFEPIREKSNRRFRDDDDDDDDLLVTSGDVDGVEGGKVGLFDVVKREFRCKTAVITNKAAYEDPSLTSTPRKPKVNFIQVSGQGGVSKLFDTQILQKTWVQFY